MTRSLILFLCFIACAYTSQAQMVNKNTIELTGVIMSADSLRYLPFVTVVNHTQGTGTSTNERGIFSLFVENGDTLDFSSVGFRKKRYVVPQTLSSNRYSIIQLMVQDTFYLPATIIRPQLSKEEFDRAFKTWYIPDDKFEIARKNTEAQTLKILALVMPRDGRESQHLAQNTQIQRNYSAGQMPPMPIFNPLAWMDFFKAWKRGDFKRKK